MGEHIQVARLSEQEALEIARRAVGALEGFGDGRASFVCDSRLERDRAEVIDLCRQNGIVEQQQIEAILHEQGLSGPFWQVAFFPKQKPGSVSTLHAVTVRVDDSTGKATVA